MGAASIGTETALAQKRFCANAASIGTEMGGLESLSFMDWDVELWY